MVRARPLEIGVAGLEGPLLAVLPGDRDGAVEHIAQAGAVMLVRRHLGPRLHGEHHHAHRPLALELADVLLLQHLGAEVLLLGLCRIGVERHQRSAQKGRSNETSRERDTVRTHHFLPYRSVMKRLWQDKTLGISISSGLSRRQPRPTGERVAPTAGPPRTRARGRASPCPPILPVPAGRAVLFCRTFAVSGPRSRFPGRAFTGRRGNDYLMKDQGFDHVS